MSLPNSSCLFTFPFKINTLGPVSFFLFFFPPVFLLPLILSCWKCVKRSCPSLLNVSTPLPLGSLLPDLANFQTAFTACRRTLWDRPLGLEAPHHPWIQFLPERHSYAMYLFAFFLLCICLLVRQFTQCTCQRASRILFSKSPKITNFVYLSGHPTL